MQVTVLNNQSLFDVAIQYYGTVEASVSIAILNGISITDELVPGQVLNVPVIDYGFSDVANYFNIEKIEPATGTSVYDIYNEDGEITTPLEGIDYWGIEYDFIVQ
jgi:LysM repeat protein